MIYTFWKLILIQVFSRKISVASDRSSTQTGPVAREKGVVERCRLEMGRNALPPVNDKLLLLLRLDIVISHQTMHLGSSLSLRSTFFFVTLSHRFPQVAAKMASGTPGLHLLILSTTKEKKHLFSYSSNKNSQV